jgi:TolA-binding protein
MSAGTSHCLVALTLAAALWTAGGARADDADDRYAVAAGHYDQARWRLAVEEFEGFLAAYPQHAKAVESHFFLAEALLQLKRHAEAAQQYQQYLDRQKQGRFAREALFRRGEAEYLAGQASAAKKTLTQFVREYPRDPLGAYSFPYLGDLALGEGNWAEAARCYRQGLEQFPDGKLQDDCRLGLARALQKQGQTDEAEKLFLALSAKRASPLAGDALFHLGALQFAAGRFAEAAATLAAFDERYPTATQRGEARLAWAWSLFKLKRAAEAKAMLERLTADQGVGIDARYWLGMIHRAEEQWAAGARVLLAGVNASPQHQRAAAMRFYAGDCLLRAGDAAGATQQFDAVLAAGDTSWADDAARGKVQAALQAKDHVAVDRHAAEFQRRFAASPLLPDVHRVHARSLLERKLSQPAIALLEPLVARRAADAGLEDRYLLTLAYQAGKRYAEGLTAVAPVVAHAQGTLQAAAQLAQGSLLLALKRDAEALPPLEAAVAGKLVGDDRLRAKAELAIALARTGKIDRAKQVFAELAGSTADNELVVSAIEQLSEAAYAAGDTTWSGELFARLAQHHTKERQWKGLAGMAWSHHKAGRLAEAADGFATLLRKNPEPALAAETALARGRTLEQLARPDEALAMYDRIAARYAQTDSYAPALLAAARLRAARHEFAEAAARFAQLAARRPPPDDLDAVLYEWSWALGDAGQTAESTRVLERLCQEFPQSRFWDDAVYRLAQRAWEAKDYRQAGARLKALLDHHPEARLREHALYLSGQIAAAEERWPEVARQMERLAADHPQSPLRLAAEYWVAEALYRQQDYEAARVRLERLAGQLPTPPEPWMGMIALRRAQVLAHRQQWDAAYAIAAKIAGEFPAFEQQYEVDYLLGRCLADRADFEGARQAYQRAIRAPQGAKTETAAKAQWMIGESYFHQKNYEAALRAYLRVEILYAFPHWQALALLEAAKCHELLGEWREAAGLYERLLARYADTLAAKDAAARLKTAQQQLARRPVRDR